MSKLFFAFLFVFLVSNSAFCQNLTVLNKLDTNYQDCLDRGKNMLLCSQKYYNQIDSLLNVAYKNYRATLTEKQKQALKSDQLKWLTLRDNYFRKVNQELEDPGSRDAQIIAIDEKAQFVRERVIYFINKSNTKNSR